MAREANAAPLRVQIGPEARERKAGRRDLGNDRAMVLWWCSLAFATAKMPKF